MVTETKYINSTSARINERNARAEEFMEGRGPGYKAAAKTGLFFANGFDRMSSLVTSEYTGGISGIISGGLGGALLGAVVSIPFAAFGGLAAVPFIIGGMATIGAVKNGYQDYKSTVRSGYKKEGAHIAERIAEMSGAVAPQVPLDPTLTPDEVLRREGRDPDKLRADYAEMQKQIVLQSTQDSLAAVADKSFVQGELDRRARTQTTTNNINP